MQAPLRRALPGLLFAAALGVSVALAAWSMHQNAAEREALFERRTEAFRLSLAATVRGYLDVLPALRLAASGPAPLDDAQFARYATTLLTADRYPGLTLGFIAERLSEADRAAYLARVRSDRSADPAGHASFDIQPPGPRPEYLVLRHQFPADPTNDGYDLFDPAQAYRKAAELAIADGGLVATPPLKLARDRQRPDHPELTSVVVRAATYRDGLPPTGAEARRAAATGVVGIGFRTAEVVRGALAAELGRDARVRITDAAGAPLPVFDNEPTATTSSDTAVQRFELPVANRRWLVEVTPHPQAWWRAADGSTLVLLGAGLVCAASLAALTAGLARARQDAEARVRDGLRQLEEDKTLLERSEMRLKLVVEHSLDAMLTTRPGGGVVAVNPAACELFGRTQAELLRARAGDIADTGDPRLSALLSQRSATGRTRGLARMRRGDGSTFEAEISSMTYQDIDGSPLASVVVRDLSAGLQAAADRERLEDQLRHAQKMQAVGTLAGGIAHDFNNVLAIVMGSAALLDGELADGDPAHAHLQRIRQAALRARTLVQQLMTFSRPPTEGLWAQPLQPLVQEAMALLRATLPTTVELKVQMADAPIHVVTEPTQVQQVLINLCNNAAQAMPDGKGHITVALDATSPPDGGPRWAHLSVRDDGSGMDTGVRERIFEPFFTTKGAGQGTGLGLSMVHGIITAHGGSVEVSSAPGRGSLFEVWLPVVDAPEDAPHAPLRAALPSRGHGERVMYVDDDEVLRLTVCALLTQLGYRAEAQADPVHALAALAAAPADVALVITDFNMPQMSGLDVAVAVQQLRADLPVLIVSGHVTEALHTAVSELDHVVILRKEFVAEQLGEQVAALLATEHVG